MNNDLAEEQLDEFIQSYIGDQLDSALSMVKSSSLDAEQVKTAVTVLEAMQNLSKAIRKATKKLLSQLLLSKLSNVSCLELNSSAVYLIPSTMLTDLINKHDLAM